MRKLIILLLTVILFLAVDAGMLWVIKPEAFSSPTALRRTGTEALAQILVRVMHLRLQLPQQIDETTALDDLHAEGAKIIYGISIAASGEDFNRTAAEIADNMAKTGCGRPDYRKMLGYGLTIVISLHAQDGTLAAPLTFTPQMCGLDK